jgi:Uma2 family endonuclease
MPDDGYRYELVRGELKKMTAAGGPHGKVANRTGWLLTHHVESNQLGVVFAAETGFRLAVDPDTVRGPDVDGCSYNRRWFFVDPSLAGARHVLSSRR